MAFQDHFSGHAADYAAFRPNYPPELFAYLAEIAPARRLAWDCGTGSGQAAVMLAEHFDQVVATDPSREQLASATPHPRVTYAEAPAERSPLAAGSVDLITVAQALHWFQFEQFYAEVRRVAAPGAILAVWCYELLHVSAEVDRWLTGYYQRVAPYWPAERRHVEAGYRTIPFPFDELQPPTFVMQAEWTLRALLGYLSTWSATKRATQSLGYDVLAATATGRNSTADSLTACWGNIERRRVEWPLILRVGSV
jgi:SAM-dependent methyltransferase